jgi:hypothetical protein|tara:strand:- start:47 stop:184 length:138 start_codon:yes stop_codon:yes gene_type:complete
MIVVAGEGVVHRGVSVVAEVVDALEAVMAMVEAMIEPQLALEVAE